MYYISSCFYHSFAMLKHIFSFHSHIVTIIHSIFIYQVSLYLCRDGDTGERGGIYWHIIRGTTISNGPELIIYQNNIKMVRFRICPFMFNVDVKD